MIVLKPFMQIWCSGNISYYFQCWKQLCCLIFNRNHSSFFGSLLNRNFKRTAFILKLYIKTIALIVTFNQFNVSLLKKKKTLGSQQAKHDADIIREGRLLSPIQFLASKLFDWDKLCVIIHWLTQYGHCSIWLFFLPALIKKVIVRCAESDKYCY